jgi:bacterioferritin
MTVEQIITLLNKDLALEYTAAVQYVQHYGVVTGPEFMVVRSQMADHAKQELDHALVLSDLIQYYGGVPVSTMPEVKTSKDVNTMLKYDLTAEETAIARYRTRIKQAEELGMYELGTKLRSILNDELDHANDLQLALGK